LFKLEKNRANCQEIADNVSELDQQCINHFINSDHWSFGDLMDQIAQQASTLFKQKRKPVGLLIDELGFRKKGKMSACVARQYLGCIGKVDNGQVVVGAGLCQDDVFAPIDMRLFMPQEWQEDTLRRRKCNIPIQETHMSKPAMAQKMIEDALAKGIAFDFVNFDALYGNTTSLLAFLESKHLDFIGDIRSNFIVHFDYNTEEGCSVKHYLNYLSSDDFELINIRQSTKGPLKAHFHYAKVQVLADQKWMDLTLLIRKDMDGKVKFSLSNMHDDHIKELAQKQGQRIFVEQMFKEGKNQVGMGDYQIRGWNGFHNHMAISMMAMLLMAKIKMEYKTEKYTATTIRKLISLCIKSKMDDPKSAIDIIFEQHSRYIRQLQRDGYFKEKT